MTVPRAPAIARVRQRWRNALDDKRALLQEAVRFPLRAAIAAGGAGTLTILTRHRAEAKRFFATPVFACVVAVLVTQQSHGQTLRFGVYTAGAVFLGGAASAISLEAFEASALNVLIALVIFCLLVLIPGPVEPIAPKMAFAVYGLCLLTARQQRHQRTDSEIVAFQQVATCVAVAVAATVLLPWPRSSYAVSSVRDNIQKAEVALGECALLLSASLRESGGGGGDPTNNPNLKNMRRLMVRVLRSTASTALAEASAQLPNLPWEPRWLFPRSGTKVPNIHARLAAIQRSETAVAGMVMAVASLEEDDAHTIRNAVRARNALPRIADDTTARALRETQQQSGVDVQTEEGGGDSTGAATCSGGNFGGGAVAGGASPPLLRLVGRGGELLQRIEDALESQCRSMDTIMAGPAAELAAEAALALTRYQHAAARGEGAAKQQAQQREGDDHPTPSSPAGPSEQMRSSNSCWRRWRDRASAAVGGGGRRQIVTRSTMVLAAVDGAGVLKVPLWIEDESEEEFLDSSTSREGGGGRGCRITAASPPQAIAAAARSSEKLQNAMPPPPAPAAPGRHDAARRWADYSSRAAPPLPPAAADAAARRKRRSAKDGTEQQQEGRDARSFFVEWVGAASGMARVALPRPPETGAAAGVAAGIPSAAAVRPLPARRPGEALRSSFLGATTPPAGSSSHAPFAETQAAGGDRPAPSPGRCSPSQPPSPGADQLRLPEPDDIEAAIARGGAAPSLPLAAAVKDRARTCSSRSRGSGGATARRAALLARLASFDASLLRAREAAYYSDASAARIEETFVGCAPLTARMAFAFCLRAFALASCPGEGVPSPVTRPPASNSPTGDGTISRRADDHGRQQAQKQDGTTGWASGVRAAVGRWRFLLRRSARGAEKALATVTDGPRTLYACKIAAAVLVSAAIAIPVTGSGVWATTATVLVGMRNGLYFGGSLRVAGDRLLGTVVGAFLGYFLLSVLGGNVDRFGGLVHLLLALWALGLGFIRLNNPRHANAAVVATLTAQVIALGSPIALPKTGQKYTAAEAEAVSQHFAYIRILENFIGVLSFALIEILVAPTSAHFALRAQVSRNVTLCGQAVSTIWHAVPVLGAVEEAAAAAPGSHAPTTTITAGAAAASPPPAAPAPDRAALLAATECAIAAFASGLARQRALQEEAVSEPNFLRGRTVPTEVYASVDYHGRRLRLLLGLMQASVRQVYDDDEAGEQAASGAEAEGGTGDAAACVAAAGGDVSGGGDDTPRKAPVSPAAAAAMARGRRVRGFLGPSLRALYERLDALFRASAAAAAVTTTASEAAAAPPEPSAADDDDDAARRLGGGSSRGTDGRSSIMPVQEAAQAALTAAAEAQEAAEAALDDVIVQYSAVMLQLRLEHAAAADAAVAAGCCPGAGGGGEEAEDSTGSSGGGGGSAASARRQAHRDAAVPNSTVVPLHAVVFFSREILVHTAGLAHAIGQLVLVETMPK